MIDIPELDRVAFFSIADAKPVINVAQGELLERLVQKMELGEQSLDESLAAYERGVALYRQCQTALEQAELRVKLLSDPGKPENAEDFPTDAG